MLPIIQNIAGALSQIASVNAVILFGSRAHGDHWERSDIDLAVACPDATRQDWHSMIDIIDSARTLYKVDLVREENNIALDASIQRFEFSFELFWKTLKVLLEGT